MPVFISICTKYERKSPPLIFVEMLLIAFWEQLRPKFKASEEKKKGPRPPRPPSKSAPDIRPTTLSCCMYVVYKNIELVIPISPLMTS